MNVNFLTHEKNVKNIPYNNYDLFYQDLIVLYGDIKLK